MNEKAYFSEWEAQPAVDGPEELATELDRRGMGLASGCIIYPITITTDHAASSYGIPVVVIGGEARGPGDMPPGEIQVTGEIAMTLRRSGYTVVPSDPWTDEDYRRGIPAHGHWHPDARFVV